MAVIGNDIERALALLRDSQLVGMPTETVYGLAGNALSEEAILEIFKAKNRPSFDPLIVHTHRIEELPKFVKSISPLAEKLAEKLWPGPLTMLFKKKSIIPDLVTSGLDTVAVRIPKHPLALELLRALEFPLAAPSANPFGYISPTKAEHVNNQLGDKVGYILDGGECGIGVESTIISFEEEKPIILRLGGQSIELIEDILGDVVVRDHSSSKPSAPGMLDSHYAPHKIFVLSTIEETLKTYRPEEIGALRSTDYNKDVPRQNQVLLSEEMNLDEMAKNLFGAMRELDQKPDIRVIVASLVPNKGLGRAINDRLKRAAAK